MSTCFKARRDDGINTRVLQGGRFVWCRRSANRDDAFRPTLIKNFCCRNSEYETESRYSFIYQDANLILKSDERIWLALWTRRLQFCEVARQRREASVESGFVRSLGTLIFHRHP